MPVLVTTVGSSLLAALCVRGVATGCRGWSFSWRKAAFLILIQPAWEGRAALLINLPGRVGSGQPNSYRGKKTKKKCYFRHAAITAMTAMASPFATRHAIAIRWRFFKKPSRLSVMALPSPPFDNTGPNKSNNIFINIMIDLNK